MHLGRLNKPVYQWTYVPPIHSELAMDNFRMLKHLRVNLCEKLLGSEFT